MSPEEQLEAIHAELQARLQQRGAAKLALAEEELGVQPGYLRDQRRRGRLELSFLLRLLHLLEIDPREFVLAALSDGGDADLVAQILAGVPDLHEGEDDAIVRAARRWIAE